MPEDHPPEANAPVFDLQPDTADAFPSAPTTAADGRASSSLASWIGAGIVAVALVVGGVVVLGRSGDDAADPAAATEQPAAAGATTDDGSRSGDPSGGRPGGRGTSGSITAIDDATFTVAATDASGADTTVTVTTDDATTYTETVEGSVADLAVGDNVVVMGESDDAVVAATSIVDSGDLAPTTAMPGGAMPGGAPPDGMTLPEGMTPPDGMTLPDGATPPEGMTPPAGGFGGAPTSGSITAIDDSTLTVALGDGTSVDVTTSADTRVSLTRSITRDDLAAGDAVRVQGTVDGSEVAATSVQVGELTRGGPGGARPGTPGAGSSSSRSSGLGSGSGSGPSAPAGDATDAEVDA